MAEPGQSPISALRDAIRLVWRASPRAAGAVLFLEVVVALLAVAQVLVLKVLLERVLQLDRQGGGIGTAVVPLTLMATAAALTSVSAVILPRIQRVLGELVARSVWSQLLDVSQNVDLETFDTPAFYNQLQRIQDNALDKPLSTTEGLMQLVNNGISSVGLVIVLFSVHWSLIPLLALAAPPTILASRINARREFTFAVAQSPTYRTRFYLSELLTERTSAKEVRAYGTGPILRQKHDATYESFIDALILQVRNTGLISAAGSLVSAVLALGALGVLVALVADHQITIAAAGTAVVSLRLLSTRVQTSTSSASTLYGNSLFLSDLADFLSLKRTMTVDAGMPMPMLTSLQLRKVGFSYPGASVPTLVDIDLDVARGSVIALVGENGSGKTTLAKVIAQLYSPTTGSVLWNGEPVQPEQRTALRDQIAVLFQDFLHYRLSARDNVTLGRASLADDDERLEAAATAAGADEVLLKLPKGWDTILSAEFGGQDLSLGQWQRVALARAWFRGSDLVILDEPTASLDPRAEARLFSDVRNLLRGRTVLLITHRLASVRTADQIIVLSDGRVVERGTHAELMHLGGHYYELFQLQASGYAEAE